jgi:hypothetical protein
VDSFNRGGEDLSDMLRKQMNGKIDSWSIIWSYAHFKKNAYCIYPTESRVMNIGVDNSGVHTNKTRKFDVKLNTTSKNIDLVRNIEPDDELLVDFRKFFRRNILYSLYNKIKLPR